MKDGNIWFLYGRLCVRKCGPVTQEKSAIPFRMMEWTQYKRWMVEWLTLQETCSSLLYQPLSFSPRSPLVVLRTH